MSLFDIWRAMPPGVFNGALLEELVEAEVALEREVTVVDLDIADMLTLARKHDIPVVLVSDTYFTADQLSHLLDRPELHALQDARVYRSHEYGKDKAGGLWQIVLDDLGLHPEQVVHIGDNEVADIAVPRDLGVRTVFYERIDARFGGVLFRERQPALAFDPFATHVDPVHGDFGLTSLRAKTLQSGAVGRETTAVGTAWRYGASVMGPPLTGFAEWVAWRAHETGTPVVWCPMREGELLAALVNNAAHTRGWNVEAKPLWLSRHVTSLAATDHYDTDSVRRFISGRYRLSVRQLLDILGLRPGDVPALGAELDTLITDDHIVDRVAAALTETPHLTNRLAVTFTGRRERLLKALRDAGALDGPELTVVDVGWGGSTQLHLTHLLKIAGLDTVVSGLYMATNERSMALLKDGLRAEGYLGQVGYPHEVVAAATRSPEFIEQSVNALCGSLLDFAEDGTPVLGTFVGSPSQNAERKALQDGILAFQQQWNRYVAAGPWPLLTGAARHRLANVFAAALKAPTQEEASVFGNWVHEDNYGSTVVTRVVPEDLLPALPYMSPNDLADLHMRDAFWPALLGASDTHLALAARAAAAGELDPEMFDSAGPAFHTRLRYRTGDGRWHDGQSRRIRVNHNGLSFARMYVRSDNVVAVSVAIPGRPSIVRVDWIEATLLTAGRTEPVVVRWEEPEAVERLALEDATSLGGNLIEFHAAEGALALPLAARVGSPVTSAQITVAFAVLPLTTSGVSHRLAPPAPGLTDRVREEYRNRGAVGVAVGASRVARRWLAGDR